MYADLVDKCTHAYLDDDGVRICTNCGLTDIPLNPEIQSFNANYRQKTIKYTRQGRFERLLKNLRGWQTVGCDIVAACVHCETILTLRTFLNSNANMRSYIGKIPSIWRNLGHRFEPMSELDIKRAIWEFNCIMEKKSFLVLLPYIIKKIGRADLLEFCKMPTIAIQKKYNLYI